MIREKAYRTAAKPLQMMQTRDGRKVIEALEKCREMRETEIWTMLRDLDRRRVNWLLGKMVRMGMINMTIRRGNNYYKVDKLSLKAIRKATRYINEQREENQI